MERSYCIYMHKNKINGKMYVGQTCKHPEYRWENGFGYRRCPHFWNAIKKYGWENFYHIILINGLTKSEADWIEVLLINALKLKDPNYGYNLTDGGEGTSGHTFIPSEEWKRKKSESQKEKFKNPEDNPMYGKRYTDEEKKKISELTKGIFAGKNNPAARSVYCIELDEVFWGAKEAHDKYGICATTISACCKGKKKSAGKHPATNIPLHWKYTDEL